MQERQTDRRITLLTSSVDSFPNSYFRRIGASALQGGRQQINWRILEGWTVTHPCGRKADAQIGGKDRAVKSESQQRQKGNGKKVCGTKELSP